MIWIGLLAVFALITLPVVLAARFEKRMVWPYGQLQESPPYDDPTGYLAEWTSDAVEAGYVLQGYAPDLKGKTYKITYALLVSPERGSVAIVGAGKILNMPLQGTWLHTLTTDGRSFYSTDSQTCVEIDVSRSWVSQLARSSSFGELLRKHQEWFQTTGAAARRFDPSRGIDEFRQLREQHFQVMARSGFISFTDLSATHWRYTLYGALKWSVLNLSIGVLRTFTFGRFPRSA